ncbi:MAG: histidine phosphatase family protein [Phycisphaerae bacterium]|nr:histidine phosphatase family protein [Phycisphaerae bacterium]
MNATEKTTVFAVRHGETEWNLAGKQQGHLDSPLTPLGVRQARAVAEALRNRGIEAIHASDLGRAVQTARIVGEVLTLEPILDARLRERHLGIMQTLTMAEFRQRFPEEYERFRSGDPDYVLPDGESSRQRDERTAACAAEIAARHRGRTVAVIAHGGTIQSLFRHALGLPAGGPRRFSLYNGAVNRFGVRDGRWTLELWGDTGHLEKAGLATLDDF